MENILNMKFEILNDSTDTLKLMIEPVPEFYVLEPGVLATLEGESPSNAIPRLDVQPDFLDHAPRMGIPVSNSSQK